MPNFNIHKVNWNDKNVAQYWDYISQNDRFSNLYYTKMVGDSLMKFLSKKITLNNKSFLDYGSGPGYILQHIINGKYTIKYSALDFSKKSIDELIDKYGSNKIFDKAYFVETTPFNIDKKFDIVSSFEVIEHLSDTHLSSMMDEIKKMLNTNGFVFITTPNDELLENNEFMCPECGCEFHRWQHMRNWTEEKLVDYMDKKGFEKVFSGTTAFGSYPLTLIRKIGIKILKGSYKAPHLYYIGKLIK